MSIANKDNIVSLWSKYFPKEIWQITDSKNQIINSFYLLFLSESGSDLISEYALDKTCHVTLDCQKLEKLVIETIGFNDFYSTLINKPVDILGCIGLSLSMIAERRNPYTEKKIVIYVRLVNLFNKELFDCMKSDKIEQLLSLEGYVVKVGNIRPLVTKASFYCNKCMMIQSVTFEDGIFSPPEVCQTSKCRNKYLELQRNQVETISYQRLKIQELSEVVSNDETARLPRTVEIEVRDDLVNKCRVGDIVTIVGIVKAMKIDVARANRSVIKDGGLHQIFLVAHSIVKRKNDNDNVDEEDKSGSNQSTSLSNDQLIMIRDIALHPMCLAILCSSFCPSIYGHELVKLGLLLGLFGGTDMSYDRNHNVKVRSDIHVLIVGDPGLGKSQLLRSAHAISNRSILVCGNTSTTAGLTVTMTKDSSNSSSIEAGALVLADRGTCCLDELDKMTCDYHSLLEAMEQQTISIAKSGVVTSFHSRASVLAAANPTAGHYNRRKTINENLKMPSALLSRFDIIFILIDKPDEIHDRRLSEHILLTHTKQSNQVLQQFQLNLPNQTSLQCNNDNISCLSQRIRDQCNQIDKKHFLPTDILRNYIIYARKFIHPKLTKSAAKVLQKFYLTMRSQESLGKNLPVTTRHLESLIRLAQARAKLELREEVNEQDAHDVIELLQESLIDAFTNDVGEIELGRRGGMSLTKQIKALIKTLQRESEIRGITLFTKSDINLYVKQLKISHDVDSLIDILRTECYLLKKGSNSYQLQCSSIL